MIICKACNKEIETKKERYVRVEDWRCEKKEVEGWWHLKCYNKSMNRDLTSLEKQAAEMLKKASAIYSNLPQELTKPKEDYIIK